MENLCFITILIWAICSPVLANYLCKPIRPKRHIGMLVTISIFCVFTSILLYNGIIHFAVSLDMFKQTAKEFSAMATVAWLMGCVFIIAHLTNHWNLLDRYQKMRVTLAEVALEDDIIQAKNKFKSRPLSLEEGERLAILRTNEFLNKRISEEQKRELDEEFENGKNNLNYEMKRQYYQELADFIIKLENKET